MLLTRVRKISARSQPVALVLPDVLRPHTPTSAHQVPLSLMRLHLQLCLANVVDHRRRVMAPHALTAEGSRAETGRNAGRNPKARLARQGQAQLAQLEQPVLGRVAQPVLLVQWLAVRSPRSTLNAWRCARPV